jgi:hypothetical protein
VSTQQGVKRFDHIVVTVGVGRKQRNHPRELIVAACDEHAPCGVSIGWQRHRTLCARTVAP